MSTIFELKEAVSTATPLMCFEFRFTDGHIERFAAQACTVEGNAYSRRVVEQQLHENSLGGEDAIGAFTRIGITLSNTDGLLSQVERTHGFKGAEVIARFVFFERGTGDVAAPPMVVFRGVADMPSLVDESRMVLAAENRFSLFHAKLPATPLQRRCPWHFPYDAETRTEALDGGANGRHSMFFRCGYSAGMAGGRGNLDGANPFTSCSGTRADCASRGMLDKDAANQTTRRFGGFTYLPASILVRTHGSRAMQPAVVNGNHPRSNDAAPLVYGQGWLTPPLIHSINDGNLTRMLLLLCDGPVEEVSRVVVNGASIPAAVEGRDMSSTGWFKRVAGGAREGSFLSKPDNDGYDPEADPHGSMTTLEVVIPNALQKGAAAPIVEVLLKGLHMLTFAESGASAGFEHSSNPAWVLLDVLLRSGWQMAEIDLPSFARAAAHCGELVEVGTWSGATHMQPRFSCNLVLQKRRSVAEILRGIREASFLFLRSNSDGMLEAAVESTLALQQPTRSTLSNATEALNGGWPVYEFGDGTSGRGGILRRSSGAPAFRIFSKPASDCPNRIYAEFQDEWNDFQTDRISLFDSREVRRRKQEVVRNSSAMGLSTYPQAARSVYAALRRATAGNTFVEFETGLRGLGVRPGDLITITYPKHGLDRQAFRITRISPSADLQTTKIIAQLHIDSWYSDTVLDAIGGIDRYRRPGSAFSTPRPLSGGIVYTDGTTNFDVVESAAPASDGSYRIQLSCGFLLPAIKVSADLAPPVTPLSSAVVPGAGSLPPGETYYYRLTSVDANGLESETTPPIVAAIPSGAGGFGVLLQPIQAANAASEIRIYRGPSTDVCYRIATLPASATTFTDTGLLYLPAVPPDTNFHHANFYWREELHPEVPNTAADSASISWATATWAADQFQGKLVWIVSGKGKGQERVILSNNANTLFVEPWTVPPDITSSFAIAQPTWHLGCKTTGTPASFQIPNTSGAVVEILGVAANALDAESPANRSVITRWMIGGGGLVPVDAEAPGQPFFTLGTRANGDFRLSGVGFGTLENTATIQSGTMEIYYRDELLDLPQARLATDIDDASTTIAFTHDPGVSEGDFLQIDHEILRVAAAGSPFSFTVERGALATSAAAHATSALPFRLEKRGMVFAVPLQFFGSPASGAFEQTFYLPHAGIAAAELWFTNRVGPGALCLQAFTGLSDYGLRTGYGGQYALFAEGYLAIEDDAAIPLIIDRDHSVQDVYATLESPATGGPVELDITLDQAVYCSLTFAQGSAFSNTVSGVFLPPLRSGGRLGINVRSVQHSSGTIPGRDLSVRIRI
ncbi:MAG: hypothetical protein IT169_00175 [Bryobacterales bacterium]|nr:hypothetical protein [Bryobacterales bacterium]